MTEQDANTKYPIKCYQCSKVLASYPPYFCDDDCKKLYWSAGPYNKSVISPRKYSIEDIQAKLKQRAKEEYERTKNESAEFFDKLLKQPAKQVTQAVTQVTEVQNSTA